MAILVVDREPLLRRCVRAILETHGFQALEAPDGRTALKEVRSKPDQISLLIAHIDAWRLTSALETTPWNSCRLCRVAASSKSHSPQVACSAPLGSCWQAPGRCCCTSDSSHAEWQGAPLALEARRKTSRCG